MTVLILIYNRNITQHTSRAPRKTFEPELLASQTQVFKLVCLSFRFRYGTKLGSTVLLLQCRTFGPAQHGPRAVTITPPLSTRRPRRDIETTYPYGTKEQDFLSWPRPIRLVLTIPCVTSVGPLLASPCVSVHMPVASVPPRVPVCGVKPREFGSDTPVTTRPGITTKIYSTR
jgi:hypothetical protein